MSKNKINLWAMSCPKCGYPGLNITYVPQETTCTLDVLSFNPIRYSDANFWMICKDFIRNHTEHLYCMFGKCSYQFNHLTQDNIKE